MPVYASFDYYDGHPSYLTPGKLYEVVKDDYTPERATGGSFHIVDDEGDDLVCLWKGCAHLDRGNWIRHDTDALVEQPDSDPAPEPRFSDLRLTRAPNGGWTITEYDVEFDSFAPLAAFSNAADLLDWLRE